MSAQAVTYSFKDTNGAMVSPLAGSLLFGGELGVGKFVVNNDTEHGAKRKAADGTIMPVFISGDDGNVTIECLQTSLVHKFLLAWHNLHKQAADAGDISQWAQTTLFLRNNVDGSQHTCTGGMPTRVPPKTYDNDGGFVTWGVMFCNIINS